MLGVRIRNARVAAGLSQAELANRIGVSRSAVANWESICSRTHPSSERLEVISHVTGLSWEWLATGRGQASLVAGSEAAIDPELVTDPAERRLLQAFRQSAGPVKQALLILAESGTAPRQR